MKARNVSLAVLCAVLFLTFLDTTVVSVALGDVQARLHAGVTGLQWVVNGYALTFASAMLLAGALADRFGRKRFLLGGLAVFGAGSLLGALAPNTGTLVAARVVMGLGAAASEPGTLSILRQLFPDERDRAEAVGAWAAVSGLALAVGPVLGGLFVALGTWRAIFWFNVAATLAVGALAAITLPESADPDQRGLDLAGFATGVVGVGSLTSAVILGEASGYGASGVVALFVAAAAALVAFVAVERRSASPMLDLAYFRVPAFSGAMVVALVLSFSIFAIFFFAALYLSAVIGYSPERLALEFLPMAVAMIAAAGLAGRRVALVGPRAPMAEGCLLAGAGILLSEVLLRDGRPSPWLLATLALAGFGVGTSIVPVSSVALGSVPSRRSGMAASAANTSRELGSVLGVAVLGALVNAHLTADLTRRLRGLAVPQRFIAIVINAIETGTVPAGVRGGSSIEDKVIEAAYAAFRAGLGDALTVAGVATLLAGLAAASFGRRAPARHFDG